MATQRAKKIGFLAFDEMQALDLFGPLETFQEANEHGGPKQRYETVVITRNGRPAVSSSGVKVAAHTSIKECPRLHTLIVVGGAGARRENFAAETLRWIKNEAPKLVRVGSICTGLFVLARTGLLDGLHASTHWHHVDEARSKFPHITVDRDALYRRHGKFFTAAGVTAGIDMALALIEEDHGPSFASDIARHLVVFFKRPGDQRQYSSALRYQTESSDEFADLIAWIPDNLTADLSSVALAQRVNLSERQFRRRFSQMFGETPTKHIERVRVEYASHWLVADTPNVDRIAKLSGFHCTDTFRRVFERRRGVTPTEYRSRFGEART